MVNIKIRQNLKRLRDKMYVTQTRALEQMWSGEDKDIQKDIDEIFILEQIFDSWHTLYNEDDHEFWTSNNSV